MAFLVCAGALTNTLEATATTIDFESLLHPDDGATNVVSPYVEDGFVLTSTWGGFSHPPFSVWGTASPNFAGSTGLFGDVGGTVFTLSRLDGSSFDVASIDLSSVYRIPVTDLRLETGFFGFRDDSSFIERNISIRPFFGFRTFALPGFTDIVFLTWSEPGLTTIVLEQHQFDNIVIAPEPGPALLLFVGLGLTGCIRFRC
jgi:hypothetical protein